MKSTRPQFIIASLCCLAFCFALVVALAGYFRSVERGNGATGTEKHLLTQLHAFHDRLKAAESADEAKAALKMVESFGYGPESELSRELKKTYGPTLAVFATKPREAEPKYLIGKKRELMEALVNSYRKEVLHGDLRVRAAYLNLLFDTQNSLVNDSDEAELVFLKRNRERLDGLKSLVAGARDPGLPVRVATIDSIFSGYDKGFQQVMRWKADKADSLAKEEKALPHIAKSMLSGEDNGVEVTRRTFLYICLLSLAVAFGSFLALYLGFKVIRLRAESKWELFLGYLRAFGSERADSPLKALAEDSEWAGVVVEAQRAEENFLRSYQSLLAVPRSLRTPFMVVTKDRAIRHWNEGATSLFGLTEGKEWTLDDFLVVDRIGVKVGEAATMIELVRNSFANLTEDRFELLVRPAGGEWAPYELTVSPISSGPIAGGKILVWREVRSEAARIDNAVAAQLERVRDLVHKVTHRYDAELEPTGADAPATRAMIGDLATLKGKFDERELLWKSEAQALLDQVMRQREVLSRLTDEMVRIRQGQSEALELVRTARGNEEHLHDEVRVLERDLERWAVNRNRLLGDLRQQSAVLERAKKFEEQLRAATGEFSEELGYFEAEIEKLHQFADAAKVHSVNISLVRDPAYWEYATRARGFALELARFAAKADEISYRMRAFVGAYPGGALAAHLDGPGLDEAAVAGIREEQERLSTMLQRWKASGENILSGGERALELLEGAEKQGAVVNQLGETSLLINKQAQGNLERWS